MGIEVSAIIPTYNRINLLGEAVESVLAQGIESLEIIIADDGSTDGTGDWLKEKYPQIRHLALPHAGVSTARNRGVDAAQGKWIAFLDSDDYWTLGKLKTQLEVARKLTEPTLIFGHYTEFSNSDENQPSSEKRKIPGFCAGTVLMLRDSFLRTGGFDPNLSVGEFVEWYDRAKQAGIASLLLPEVLLQRRVHGGNTVAPAGAPSKKYIQAIKAVLERRRKAAAEARGKDSN